MVRYGTSVRVQKWNVRQVASADGSTGSLRWRYIYLSYDSSGKAVRLLFFTKCEKEQGACYFL
jgi:hypothetical protein